MLDTLQLLVGANLFVLGLSLLIFDIPRVAGFGRGHVGMAGGFSREHAGGLGAAL
jgi:hypothetical protein